MINRLNEFNNVLDSEWSNDVFCFVYHRVLNQKIMLQTVQSLNLRMGFGNKLQL